MEEFWKVYKKIELYYSKYVTIPEKHYYYDWLYENQEIMNSVVNSENVNEDIIWIQLIELMIILKEDEECLKEQLLRKWLVQSIVNIYEDCVSQI